MSRFSQINYIGILLLTAALAACESNSPAPVIERAPNKPAPPGKPPTGVPKASDTKASKDWRPDSYLVKKGDTLFSIGLEFGYDYKDIAATNNIAPPYAIKIGQKLSFSGLNNKVAANTTDVKSIENDDGVVISPIKTDTAGTAISNENKAPSSAVTPILNEPKAIREVYSIETMNRKATETKPATESKTTDTKAAEAKPTEPKQDNVSDSKVTPVGDDENLSWLWPTQGKVIAGFNDASSKGIDIGGSIGQAVNAAAPGKVIYTGADLRGYGKLVIIKHNKAYLSVYAHNSKILVKEGQSITAGQKIAEMGNSDSNTTNLHFEIRHQGKSVDPAKYLPQN